MISGLCRLEYSPAEGQLIRLIYSSSVGTARNENVVMRNRGKQKVRLGGDGVDVVDCISMRRCRIWLREEGGREPGLGLGR